MKDKSIPYRLLPFFLSFIIPACVLIAILAKSNVFPTDEKSILTIDLAVQYTDFFSYFKSFFSGENNLFYCLSQTLGNNMWGILPYYLLSPFNFIILFFTSAQLPTAIYIMTILKIGTCGITCYIFLNKIFHSRYCSLIFAVCYALMGFNIIYLSHIMWLDGIILLPMIALGIHRIIDKKRPLCYIISLFLALVTNYYIGYMLCIFTVLYFLYCVLRFLPTESKLKYFWHKVKNYIISSLIAGGMAAVVLLPAFMALSGGKSEGTKNLSFTFIHSFLNIFGNLYTNTFEFDDIRYGLPNIFIGMFVLVLAVLFFTHKTIDLKSKLLAGSMIAVFILSFNIAAFDLAWQAFTPPNQFTHRYAFIFSFILITMAIESFQALRAFEPPIVRYSVTGVSVLAVTVLLSYVTGRFHSALKYALLDLGLIILFFVLLYFLHVQSKKWMQIILTLGIGIVCTGNVSLNAYAVLRQMPYQVNASYLDFHKDAAPVIEKAKSFTGSSVLRVEKDFIYTFNDAMQFSYPGITHYSSNLKTNLVNFFNKTGYKSNGVFISNGQGNTLAFDSIYNVKYFISKSRYFPQYQSIYQESQYTIYENPFALGLGFTIPANMDTLEFSNDNPFISQNNVFRCFVPEVRQDIFVAEELLNTQSENLNVINKDDGIIVLEKINTEQPASISYTYKRNGVKDPVYMCFGNSERSLKAYVKLNDEDVFYDHYYHGVFYDYIHPVLISDDDDTYTITVELTEDSFVLGTPYVYRQDMAAFEMYYHSLADGSFQPNKNSSSSFSGQVTAKENETLFLSLPYENGWSVYIDGQKAETKKVFDTFLAVNIPQGVHTVALSYIPPGLVVGGIVSGISALALAGYLVLLYRSNQKIQKSK